MCDTGRDRHPHGSRHDRASLALQPMSTRSQATAFGVRYRSQEPTQTRVSASISPDKATKAARSASRGRAEGEAGSDDAGGEPGGAERGGKSGRGPPAGAVSGCDDLWDDEVGKVLDGGVDPILDGGPC